ncbi:MAG: carboxypeptidase regulatory-like domain-containing protein [Ignavibacteriae bacterium]|nr:carboxypeptidase regulatory-like domain-containing protein [Ignavibacteriota bacterium]
MRRFLQLFSTTLLLLVSAVCMIAQVPEPPSNLTVYPGVNGGAILRWDSSAGAGGYRVYKSVDEMPFDRIAGTSRNAFFDWAIYPHHRYRYYVTAVNVDGESDPSEIVEFRPGLPPPPPVHGVITGVITDDSTGLPLREAVVRFFRPNGLWSAHTHTDTGGAYWAPLDTGKYVIHAEKFGYVPEWFDNALRIADATIVELHQDTVVANFGLRPLPPLIPVSVSGTVTDSATGSPLSNALVAFLRPHRLFRQLQHMLGFFGGFPFERFEIPGHGHWHGVVWAGLTDSAGNYKANLLSGLRYIAVAFKPGYVLEFYQNKATPFDADRLSFSGDTSGINFDLIRNPLATNTIFGSVVDSAGTGVSSHVVLLRLFPRGPVPVRYRTTDSLGNYEFHNLAPGRFFVRAIPIDGYAPAWYKAGYCGVSNWHNADTIVLTGDINGIDICVKPISDGGFARIAGQILESGGNVLSMVPVQSATVYAVDNSTNTIVSYDVTEDDGSYSIDNLPAGSYQIVVDKEGYTAMTTPTFTVDSNNDFEVSGTSITVTPDSPLDAGNDYSTLPAKFRLDQNYPNPFNPATEIRFDLPVQSSVSLKIFNILGQEIVELRNELLQAGNFKVRWNGTDKEGKAVTSGIYFIKFVATPVNRELSAFTQVRKMTLLK